jgi:SEC-C motif-containing protein
MQPCPCGTGKNYVECCGVFIEDQQTPLTPEALMRSRYTAYTQANTDYLLQTMKAPAKARFDAKSSAEWAMQVKWIKLDIKMASTQESKGVVEFIAYFKEKGKLNAIHERSEFQYEEGVWYYVDGEHLPLSDSSFFHLRIGRNDLCPCGSGKKYKTCCL